MSYESELDRLDNLSASDPLCWVYVLKTDDGSYVGQTTDLERRVGEHIKGYSSSTAGISPYLIWEKRLLTRGHADSYERVLKTLRDCDQATFYELTGVQPQAWVGVGSDFKRERIEERQSELEQHTREWQQQLREKTEQRRREGKRRQRERTRTIWKRQREREPYPRKPEIVLSPEHERVTWGKSVLHLSITILQVATFLLGFLVVMLIARFIDSIMGDDLWTGWRLLGTVVIMISCAIILPAAAVLCDKMQSLTWRERDQRR